MTIRFGVFGTGYWAAEVHCAAVDAEPGFEVAGVWGRDPGKASALAARYGAASYDDIDAMIRDVDAIAVALPPDVQAPIAALAARAGRHLLLDKPLALTSQAARAVTDAVDASGVASVVFFTNRFLPAAAAWLDEQSAQTWTGGRAELVASIFADGGPFGQSPWRREKGGLWDVGPHALSVLLPLLGPVRDVAAATRDLHGTVHLLLEHGSGAVSSLALGIDAPLAAAATSISVYGPSGRAVMPTVEWDAVTAYREALRQLSAVAAVPGTRHPCDVHFAAEVVRVLEQAQALLDARATAAHG
jgi:predicted dehydrogenase